MTNNQITITHHPATDTAPQHWRSSDGYWSAEGSVWFQHDGMFPITTSQIQANHRAAFFNQILNTETEPRRAKVGDRVLFFQPNPKGPHEVLESDNHSIKTAIGSMLHYGRSGALNYTIVDPPQPLTAKGSEITQKDGVWERSDRTVRVLIADGDISVVLCGDQDAPGYCGGWWKDIDGFEDLSFAHISDDPRDLTDWEVE